MSRIRVRDLMTTEVLTIGVGESIDVAEQLMAAARVHHLPVVGAAMELVGLVTETDILRAQVSSFAEVSPAEVDEFMRAIPVTSVMTSPVVTVTPDESAEQAAHVLRRHKFGCLPVVSEGCLVGILTEGDFVDLATRALEAEGGLLVGEPTQSRARDSSGARAR